ncbi:hypothetical protein L1987_03491 [Smallanthus sonchifolius]|uniref:Uncharacterized protein n=1 Tax=Smallanthus sonchifolius TaxID=185202 RepID=A0ACB9KAU7_9ASTR|nr:hypothetical protein L1987_03491 [Smallanthus sonchifolius]
MILTMRSLVKIPGLGVRQQTTTPLNHVSRSHWISPTGSLSYPLKTSVPGPINPSPNPYPFFTIQFDLLSDSSHLLQEFANFSRCRSSLRRSRERQSLSKSRAPTPLIT